MVRTARRRANARFGFLIHLIVFSAVDAMLVFINQRTTPGIGWFGGSFVASAMLGDPWTRERIASSERAAVGNAVRMVPVAEVCYFQAADKYTSVVTRDAELLIRSPLKDLLAQLPQEHFRQIHRGTIVNLAEAASYGHVIHRTPDRRPMV